MTLKNETLLGYATIDLETDHNPGVYKHSTVRYLIRNWLFGDTSL